MDRHGIKAHVFRHGEDKSEFSLSLSSVALSSSSSSSSLSFFFAGSIVHPIGGRQGKFTRKTRWVKDGHKTPDSLTSSFTGVVSCDSIHITLTHAALLGLPVLGADIRNAYLQAPSLEKHYIICGLEFGIENEGRVGLIR